MQDSTNTHLIIIFLLFITIVNLFILDLKVFNPASNVLISDISTSNISPTTFTQPTTYYTSTPLGVNPQPIANNLSCPSACLSLIQQRYVSSNTEVVVQTKEFYIPLGSGTTAKSDWEDLTATETVIDPANYGMIKEAYFIASLKNSTQNGQVEAQLYNVTDKHPVWNSQVIMNGPISQTITSPVITLDRGNKLYRVQLKSTLGYAVSLDNAKIKIISK